MCEIHLRRNANQRPNSWEYEKTPFFRRINKKLLSHHEAYEGDEGFGKLFTFQFLNFVPLANLRGEIFVFFWVLGQSFYTSPFS